MTCILSFCDTLSASYDTARKIKESQDTYCAKALAGEWDGLGNFPEDLQWEALVDVLRGRVKVLITAECLFALTLAFLRFILTVMKQLTLMILFEYV